MSPLASNILEITLHELITKGEQILIAYDKPDAKIDARLLMCYLLGCKQLNLILNKDEITSRQLEESYMYLIAKRTQGIPLQYITKSQEFMALDFYVDERVLIPRQDTETLVETVIHIIKKEQIHQVVDIGSGSGCISISLAHYLSDIKITAMDISQGALDITYKNAAFHGVSDRITCIKSDLFSDFTGELNSIDLVISNPPYISKEECETLMQEVNDYEPKLALTDGLDGLSFYRRISNEVKPFLKPNGIIAYEIGYNQAEAVKDILANAGFENIEVIKDLAGKDRVVIARNNIL